MYHHPLPGNSEPTVLYCHYVCLAGSAWKAESGLSFVTQYPVHSSSSGILNKWWLSHLDLGQSVSLLLTTLCEIAQGWGRDTGFGVKGSGLESQLQASRSWGHHFISLTLSILIH